MFNTLPIVGIACDVISNGPHQFHGAGEKYINALAHGAKVMPMLLPAFGDGKDIRDLNKIYSVQNIVSSLSGLTSFTQPESSSAQIASAVIKRVRTLTLLLSAAVLH